MNSAGTVIAYNDDYSGTDQCSSTYNSYLKKDLDAGTYYIVSEGYSANGVIMTSISGKYNKMKGDTFDNPFDIGTFNRDFQYSNTQNTANFCNDDTTRLSNDVYYKFTLCKKLLITMSHCGSKIDTYMTLQPLYYGIVFL